MDAEERRNVTAAQRVSETLQESDERFRRLVAELQVGVLILGRHAEILFANRASLELLGFSEDELLGRTTIDVGSLTVREDGSPFPGEELPGPTALATGRPVRDVVLGFYRPAIKDRVWLLVNADPHMGADGRPEQVVVTISEITSRRRVEEKLRESEARYRQLVEEAQDLIYRTDVRGYFTYVNPVARRVTGHSEATLLGKHLTELVRDDHRERVTALLRSQLRDHTLSSYDEFAIVARDGRELWVGQNVQLILEGERPVGLQAVARDITDRKRAQQALELERGQLQEIVANAPVAMALLDRQAHYIAQNQKWRRYRSATGRLPEKYHQAFRRALLGEVVEESEDAFVRADGTRVYLRWSLQPWRGQAGRVDGVVAVVQNVDMLVRSREAALQASRLKSSFLANMSHELRTPLNGVLGMARLLLEGPLEATQRERAEAIAASGSDLLKVLTGILEYAELEGGAVELNPAAVALGSLVDEVIEAFVDEAAAKELKLTAVVAPELPERMRADRVRLTQVLSRLVANAVKFTSSGSVVLRALRRDGPEGPRARFEIEDTGIGVAQAALPQLFEPFQQADSSLARRHGGTGLGLAIARRWAEAMGGEIGLVPRSSPGSLFFLELPLQAAEVAATPARAAAPTDATAATEASPLVLVVEDNPVNQKVTSAMLENLGYRSDVASSGLDALQACSQASYDAILMDCQMPDMDGFKATAWIRQREAEAGRRTPIIALTASIMPGDREKCLAAGMDDYLSKPVRLQTLDSTLRRWMTRPGPAPATPQGVAQAGPESALPPEHPLRLLEAQGRSSVVAEIIDLFLQTTPLRLEALRQVLPRGDFETVASVAHNLKGAALQIGARSVAELCARIQAEARRADATEVELLVDSLEQQYHEVRRVLELERARLKQP
jgi:PAS domain S-box-containing protein